MRPHLLITAACLVALTGAPVGALAGPASSAFDGDVTFGSGGALTLDIEGLTPGTHHDQVTVAGSATLDGAVALVPGGGFVPLAGDSFTLLTWGSRAGEFATVSGVQQPAELDLALRYDAGAAIVAVVARGDVNGDGFLNAADQAIVDANQGLTTTDYTAGDVDGDGDVDSADAAIVQNAVANAPAVPSLAGSALALLTALLLAAGFRRAQRS